MHFDITEMTDFSGDEAHIYSVTLEDEEQTLLEQFFEENKNYGDELQSIASKLYVMGNTTGCRTHFFKHNEGVPGDGVAALRMGRLRLYCLYYDHTAVFFGSGGYKPPEICAYQEDEVLNEKASQMKEIARKINQAIINKDIKIEEDGSLTINSWDYD